MLAILRAIRDLTSAALFRAFILTTLIYALYLTAIIALPELRAIWDGDVRVTDFRYLGPNMPYAAMLGVIAAFLTCFIISLIFQRAALSEHLQKPLIKAFGAYTISTFLWGAVLCMTTFIAFFILIFFVFLITLWNGDIGQPLTDPSLLGKTQEELAHLRYRSFLIGLMMCFPFVVSLVWFALRYSLIIPAAAIGTPISLTSSWKKTKPYVVALIALVFSMVLLLFLCWALVGHWYKYIPSKHSIGYAVSHGVIFYTFLICINAIAAGLFNRTCTQELTPETC